MQIDIDEQREMLRELRNEGYLDEQIDAARAECCGACAQDGIDLLIEMQGKWTDQEPAEGCDEAFIEKSYKYLDNKYLGESSS